MADIGANADQAFFKQDGGTLSILAQQASQTGTVIIGGQNNSTSPTYASFAGTGVTLNGASIVVSTGSLFYLAPQVRAYIYNHQTAQNIK